MKQNPHAMNSVNFTLKMPLAYHPELSTKELPDINKYPGCIYTCARCQNTEEHDAGVQDCTLSQHLADCSVYRCSHHLKYMQIRTLTLGLLPQGHPTYFTCREAVPKQECTRTHDKQQERLLTQSPRSKSLDRQPSGRSRSRHSLSNSILCLKRSAAQLFALQLQM